MVLTEKQKKQRINQGFCDADVWDTGIYIAEMIPKMLKRMRKNGQSRPVGFKTREQWEDVLRQIERGFKSGVIVFNGAYDDTPMNSLDFHEKRYDKGMKLFSKYLFDLWD